MHTISETAALFTHPGRIRIRLAAKLDCQKFGHVQPHLAKEPVAHMDQTDLQSQLMIYKRNQQVELHTEQGIWMAIVMNERKEYSTIFSWYQKINRCQQNA